MTRDGNNLNTTDKLKLLEKYITLCLNRKYLCFSSTQTFMKQTIY